MSIETKLISGKWRLIETETGNIASNKNNRPIDGGGHEDEDKAKRQAGYINSAVAKKD